MKRWTSVEAAWTPTQPAAANGGNGTWAQQENAEALCRTRTVDPLSMKKGGASSRRLSYRPVRAGAAVVGGERCSSLYRLLAWEDMADGSSLRWRSSLGTVRRPGGRWRLWERRVGCG